MTTFACAESLKISGLGFFDNWRTKNLALTLRSDDSPTEYFDVGFIENALFLIHSRVESAGYLYPQYTVRLRTLDGEESEFFWQGNDLLAAPIDLEIEEAEIIVEKGVFFHYTGIEFTGLQAIEDDTASEYFFLDRFLFFDRGNRAFSPNAFKRSLGALQAILRQQGYQQATVTGEEIRRDLETGEVEVRVLVAEGPRHMVTTVRTEVNTVHHPEGVAEVTFDQQQEIYAPFSSNWRQDFARRILEKFYEAGYAEAQAEFEVLERTPVDHEIHLSLLLRVTPGPRLTVGKVNFKGQGRTLEKVLRRRIKLSEGDWLNPLQLERDRFALYDLGVFNRVQANYQLDSDSTAPGGTTPLEDSSPISTDINFLFEPTEHLSIDLLLGYGSYEMLRGGFEVTRNNLWGRAHADRFLFIQSFKSTQAEYRYQLPGFLDVNNDLSLRLRGLLRDEVSFRRKEVGIEARLNRDLQIIDGATASIGYRLERVEAAGIETGIARQEARVGSLFGNLALVRLDNPIFPEDGFRIRSEVEFGSTLLGGQVDFQRFEVEGVYHYPLSRTTLFHGSLSHGILTTLTSDSHQIPLAHRFFPGGEDSIRGYTEGEAAPIDVNGEFVGAAAYALLSLEIEQFLMEKLSFVVFTDGLLQSRELDNYLSDDFLLTTGIGLRYRTIVGPLRLEAGFNPIRRDFDPDITVHLSLGYPF